MKRIIYSLFLLSAVVMTSCSIDEIDVFQADTIYVEFGDDEYSTSFLEYPGKTEVVYNLPIKMHGTTLTEEREIVISADSTSTAVEGVHYKLADKYVMPVGVYEATIPITLILTSDMEDVTYKLVLNINDSDNVGRAEDKQTILSINNQIFQPDWWTKSSVVYKNLLGAYSQKKFEYFIQVTGVSDMSDMSYAEMLGYTVEYKNWLDAQDPRVRDEDGDIIELVF